MKLLGIFNLLFLLTFLFTFHQPCFSASPVNHFIKENPGFISISQDYNFDLVDPFEADLHVVRSEAKPKLIALIQFLKLKQKKNKKLIAALLAFPFPFGIVGLHRIYLGSPPHVPIVYIASFGGVFGLLPLMDFFVILFEKNIENYMNNDKIFMWVK